MPGRRTEQKKRRAWGSEDQQLERQPRGALRYLSSNATQNDTSRRYSLHLHHGGVTEFRSAFTVTKRRPNGRYASCFAGTMCWRRLCMDAPTIIQCVSCPYQVHRASTEPSSFFPPGGRGENHARAELKKRSIQSHTNRTCFGLSYPFVWCTEHN